MDIANLIKIIGGISILNTLTVEAIKKLSEKSGNNIPANIIAAISAVFLSIAVCTMYIVYNEIAITAQVIVEIIVVVYLSFLCSTVTFDKVKQALEQIGGN